MNFDVPQAEKFWRQKISQQVSLYVLQNMDEMSLETLDWIEHLQKVIGNEDAV